MSLLRPHHAQGSRSCRYGSFRPKWHRGKLWSAQFRPPLNSERLPAAASSSPVVRTTFDKTSLSHSASLSLLVSSLLVVAHGCCMYYRRCRATPYVGCAALLAALVESDCAQDCNCLLPFSLPPPSLHATDPTLPPSNLITLPADREFGIADGWGTKKGADHSARLRESKTNHGNGVRVTQKRGSGEGSGRVGWLIVLHRGRCWAPWSRRGWATCCILQGFCKEANSYYPRMLIMGKENSSNFKIG